MHPKRFGRRICTWGKVRGIVVGSSGGGWCLVVGCWWVVVVVVVVVELVDGGGGGGGGGLRIGRLVWWRASAILNRCGTGQRSANAAVHRRPTISMEA